MEVFVACCLSGYRMSWKLNIIVFENAHASSYLTIDISEKVLHFKCCEESFISSETNEN